MRTTRQIFAALLQRAQLEAPDLRVRLRVGRASEFPAARDHAYCSLSRGKIKIVVAPKLLRASIQRQAGVLAHELGHALLFRAGLPEHGERHADEVARRVTGQRVKYDQEDVQTLGRGKRVRPRYLPK